MNGYGTETLTVLMPCRVVKNKNLLYIWIMPMCQSFFFFKSCFAKKQYIRYSNTMHER